MPFATADDPFATANDTCAHKSPDNIRQRKPCAAQPGAHGVDSGNAAPERA
jgi:hypothetical protein